MVWSIRRVVSECIGEAVGQMSRRGVRYFIYDVSAALIVALTGLGAVEDL
jgi:hypothetical protein